MADDEKSLMNGSNTGKESSYGSSNSLCVRHWKVIFAGSGVVLLITLGVVLGASFNKNNKEYIAVKATRNYFPYKKIRLPGNVIPEKYNVYLHPNITDNIFGFSGNVRILVKCHDETDNIILHIKDLNVSKVNVYKGEDAYKSPDAAGKSLATIIINNNDTNKNDLLLFDKTNEFMRIDLNGSKLEKDKKYVITISYEGSLSGGLEGFYKSSYKTKSGETRYLATTHFEATAARTAFPCFDEPAMKAKFRIIITKEKQHTALSNMPVEKIANRSDNLQDVYFKESVKMSTYLVAFVVCDYVKLTNKTTRGTTVNVWAPPEQISQAKFAMEVAPKVLEYYEKFFKVNFPLPKQDLIAIPDFAAGAMENWGLITYRLTSILYDEKESSTANKQWVAVVIAHELAHQWFGNLVTMQWWRDLWLNEGFAAFVEFIGANHTDPSWKMMDQFIIDDVQTSMALDSHVNSHPISVPVHNPSQINEIFDTISYDKGASIIRMMKHFLGSDVFHSGLTNYLQKYKFGNAVSNQLWECLDNAAKKHGKNFKKSVKDVMDTWTLQMGYPVVTVSIVGENAVATQKHFIVDAVKEGSVKPSQFGYKWHIPLTYFTKDNPDVKIKWFYMEEEKTSFKLNKSAPWYKLNTHQMGFYRVNYDKNNWEALSRQLQQDHTALSPADRSNLIDDSFELAKAGYVDQIQALNMTAYLKAETKYVPWITALSSLSYIGSMLQGKDGYDIYEKYIVQQVEKQANKLGWKDEGEHLKKYLRGAILRSAVQHGHNHSINEARKIFKAYKENNTPIPANLRSIVYLAAMKYGDVKDWEYLLNLYNTTVYPSEQRKLMFALTETKNMALLKRYLKMTLDKNIIRSQDSCSVIEHIAMNPVSSELAYNFVKDNWDELFKRYGESAFDMSSLIKTVFGQFKSKRRLKAVKKFLDEKAKENKIGSGKLAAKQAVAAIKNHIKWIEKNGKAVTDWLKNQVKFTISKRAVYFM